MSSITHIKETVRVFEDRVEKTGPPAMQRIEAAKLMRAHQIGSKTGLFITPRLLKYNDDSGLLVMERIQGIQGIRYARLDSTVYLGMMKQAGEALAAVHDQLTLPEKMKIALPDSFDGADRVFIHGDFSGENVCVTLHGAPKLVLIDWQMTRLHGGKATFGSRYYDVAWFINNLFSKPLHRFLQRLDVKKYADAFLSAYLESSNVANHITFLEYQKDFFEFKMALRQERMSVLRKIVFAKGHKSWKQFVYIQANQVRDSGFR